MYCSVGFGAAFNPPLLAKIQLGNSEDESHLLGKAVTHRERLSTVADVGIANWPPQHSCPRDGAQAGQSGWLRVPAAQQSPVQPGLSILLRAEPGHPSRESRAAQSE